jgi:hypothetical protein
MKGSRLAAIVFLLTTTGCDWPYRFDLPLDVSMDDAVDEPASDSAHDQAEADTVHDPDAVMDTSEDAAGDGDAAGDPLDDTGVADTTDEDPGDVEPEGCDEDGDTYLSVACGGDDCDDSDDSIYPGAPATCDAVDDDCSGSFLDEAGADDDGDGYLDEACGGDDCDDSDDSISPAADELYCDLVDDDCDGDAIDGPADDDDDDFIDESACGALPAADDCDDTDPTVHPGAEETCADGVDQDCDGSADGFALMTSGVQVTWSGQYATDVSAVWTGSEFGIAWKDFRDANDEIYFGIVTGEGVRSGTDVRVTFDAGTSAYPWVTWTGSEFGVAWEDRRDGNTDIYFRGLDATGTLLGSELRVTDHFTFSEEPAIAWTGSQYLLAFTDARDASPAGLQIYTATVDALGATSGAPARLSEESQSAREVAMVWATSFGGVAWLDERNAEQDIYFALVDDGGARIGSDLRLTNASSGQRGDPTVTWLGTSFAVAWFDDEGEGRALYHGGVDTDGTEIGSETEVTTDASMVHEPSIAWSGSLLGVAWYDHKAGNDEVYFTLLSPDGAVVGSEVRVTDDPSASRDPDVCWTGSSFAVFYDDDRSGNTELYLDLLAFCE